MEYRKLGASGLKVSALSLGAWVTYGGQVDEEVALECMKEAFAAGVNFFDNAEAYGMGRAEQIMGNVIRRLGWGRSEYLVSTKIFWGGPGPNEQGLSRKHVLEGTDAALQRLQVEYVDLVFCHRPDLHTPVEETVRAMSHLVTSGRALYWGTSEWSAELLQEAVAVARRERLVPPTMEQPQYNMLHRDRVEREYARLYRDPGLGTTVWSPLASGLLTGKYLDRIPDDSRLALEDYRWLRERALEGEAAARNLERVRGLQPIADDLGCTLAQLALAWCLRNPDVSTVITGASRPEQVRENMAAVELVGRLDDAVLERIEQVLDNRPAPELDWRRN